MSSCKSQSTNRITMPKLHNHQPSCRTVSRGLTKFIICLESSENLLLMVELGSLSLSVDSSTSELCGDVGTSKSCLGLMIHRHATNANNKTTTRIVGCKINFHFFVCHHGKFCHSLLKGFAVKLMMLKPSGCQHKHDYDFDVSSNSVDKLFPWQNVWILSIMITGGGLSSKNDFISYLISIQNQTSSCKEALWPTNDQWSNTRDSNGNRDLWHLICIISQKGVMTNKLNLCMMELT